MQKYMYYMIWISTEYVDVPMVLFHDMKTNKYDGECVHMLYLNSKERQPPRKNPDYTRLLEQTSVSVCRGN